MLQTLKIIMYNDVIDFVPVATSIKIRKDGTSLKITEAEPYFEYKQTGVRRELLYTITFKSGFYVVEAAKLGLVVYYDGSAASIQLSKYYRGKQCGMCGSMNGRKDQTEFLGPHLCAYTNTTNFTYSYAVPTSQCTVPSFTKPKYCHKSPSYSNLTEGKN